LNTIQKAQTETEKKKIIKLI